MDDGARWHGPGAPRTALSRADEARQQPLFRDGGQFQATVALMPQCLIS